MNNLLQKLVDGIQEQPTYQQLRAKWDELDAQSKTYLQGAAAVGAVLLAGWITIGSWWKVHSIRREILEKDEIIRMVQGASDEMRELRDRIPPSRSAEPDPQPWNTYFESVAGSAGVDKASLEVSTESSGQVRELSKESFFEISLKKVNVKQLARFSFQVENGRRPVKIRKLSVETKADLSGYLDAKISVAAYTMKSPS
jgi:hypothetical protein